MDNYEHRFYGYEKCIKIYTIYVDVYGYQV